MSYMCINFNFQIYKLNVLFVYVHWEASLCYFKAWIMKFNQNYRVLNTALRGPTLIFQVKAKAKA